MFDPHEAEADLSSSGMIQTLLSPVASSWDRKTKVPASAVAGPLIAAFSSCAKAGIVSSRKAISVRMV